MVDTFDGDQDLASVLVPLPITESVITAITANGATMPEDTNPAYSSATTYATGARVYSATAHRVYESLKDSNTNHDPTSALNQFTATGAPSWWVDISPTNRWAMFDGLISTPTSGTASVSFTMRPGAFNAVDLFGLDGDTISVVVKDAPGGNVIYTTNGDVTLEGSAPADYYEYFFSPFKPQTKFTVTNLQPYSSAELTVTVKKATGLAKIGMVSVGDLKPLGIPQRGARVSPRTYSYIGEDGYGNFKIQRRPSAVGLTIPIMVELEQADDIAQTIQDLLDVPVAVIGSNAEYHTALNTFGLISGEMDYSTYPYRTLNLSVKGYA